MEEVWVIEIEEAAEVICSWRKSTNSLWFNGRIE